MPKKEYEIAKRSYINYSEYVNDTEKKLSRLNIEVKRLGKIISEYENHIRGLEKQIADYENHCSAEKNCVAGKINMREGSG